MREFDSNVIDGDLEPDATEADESETRGSETDGLETESTASPHDQHYQLRALYGVLCKKQGEFDEFRMIMASYRVDGMVAEPPEARVLRDMATQRAREWTGLPIRCFSPFQMLQWRKLLVEDRENVSICPTI